MRRLRRFGALTILAMGLVVAIPVRGGPTNVQVTYSEVHPVAVAGCSAVAGHHVASLLDEDATTYWLSKGTGIGCTLAFTFRPAVAVASLNVVSGAGPGVVAFVRHERPKRVSLSVNGRTTGVTLADTPVSQSVNVGGRSTSTLKVTIESVYPAATAEVGLTDLQFLVVSTRSST